MAKQIRWSPEAARGFEEICNYITKDSEYYAALFAKKTIAIVKEIPDFLRSGRIVPEYGDAHLREKIYQNYRIVYRIKKDIIEIVVVTHGANTFKV